MNDLKSRLSIFLLIAACFSLTSSAATEAVAASMSPIVQLQDSRQEESGAKQEEKSTQESDEKPAKERESDKKQADEKPAEKSKHGDASKQDEAKGESELKSEKKPQTKEAADQEEGSDEKSDEKSEEKSDEEKAKKPVTTRKRRVSREQERINTYSKQASGFVDVFGPVVSSANESTLSVVSGKEQVALGTVVDSDGLILTKASELKGAIGCRLHDGTILAAQVIGIDPETDLALIKIEAENLNVVQWSQEPPPVTGRWLATPKAAEDADDNPLPAVGIVSVDVRIIPPSLAFIGINMVNVGEGGGVRITNVVAKAPADLADLWVNDVLYGIDDFTITDVDSLRKSIEENFNVNDRVTLKVRRGQKEMEIRLTFAERDKVSPDYSRNIMQNSMGSVLSRRRKKFPAAFQHDSMLSSNTCGGPIVDLSGKVVGVNIARAGRVSSLAIPTFEVLGIIEKMKTGDYSPAIVNKEAILSITSELADIEAKYAHLPDKKEVLERKYNAEKARLGEVQKMISDLKKRLSEVEGKSRKYKSEFDSVSNEIDNIEKNRQRLEADLKQLQTGSR